MAVNLDPQVNQIHDFLSQVRSFKKHAMTVSYAAIGNRLLVGSGVVSKFLKKPYAGKLSRNFVKLNPKEVATWPKNCQSIGKKLQPEDIISFLQQNLPHLPIEVCRSVFLNLDYQSLANARKTCKIWNSIIEKFDNSIIEKFNKKDWKQIYGNSLLMFSERIKDDSEFKKIRGNLNRLSPDPFFSIVLYNSLVMGKGTKINFNPIEKNATILLEVLGVDILPSVVKRVTGCYSDESGSEESEDEDRGYAVQKIAILSRDNEKIDEFFQKIDDNSIGTNEMSIRNFLWANKHLIILDGGNNLFYHEVKKRDVIQESKVLERITGSQQGNENQVYSEFNVAYLINHLVLFSFVTRLESREGVLNKIRYWRLFNTKDKSFSKINPEAVRILQIIPQNK